MLLTFFFHNYLLFRLGFFFELMLKVDVIYDKIEVLSLAFLFAFIIASKKTIASNISIFKDQNIDKLYLTKNDFYFKASLYI